MVKAKEEPKCSSEAFVYLCGEKKPVQSYLVARVIAGEVGEDASCTSQHVDVI